MYIYTGDNNRTNYIVYLNPSRKKIILILTRKRNRKKNTLLLNILYIYIYIP